MELLFDGCLTPSEVTRKDLFPWEFLFHNRSNISEGKLRGILQILNYLKPEAFTQIRV
jgi:hypothetical protein